ncbi:hypothetical protein TNCT_611111 [Trichonephila clavata]|uniref:Uncharacterized protein n=1 Tax=Trichonephila clavata TaxID=2740835 RepID=A0A8X6GGZ8_TRICU|nr:hypothetical protein TNCT_611111 [Trichonephila clavata]
MCPVRLERVKLSHITIVCIETILGVQLDAMGDEGSNYMTSFKRVSEICFSRIYKVLQWPDWIFRFTPTYRDMKFHTRVMHNFLTKGSSP